MRRIPKPISDITALPYPRLGWVYDQGTGRGPMHIADNTCKRDATSVHRLPYTRCKRAIDFHHYINNGITKAEPSLDGFNLCSRCGSREQFEGALTAHIAGHALQTAEYRKRREAERERDEQEYQERLRRVERLKQILNVGKFIEDQSYLISFEHEGFRYHVNEDGPTRSKE